MSLCMYTLHGTWEMCAWHVAICNNAIEGAVWPFLFYICLPACPADGTLKLWDLRKFKTPVQQADNLPCNYATTQVDARSSPLLCSSCSSGVSCSNRLVVLVTESAGPLLPPADPRLSPVAFFPLLPVCLPAAVLLQPR